MSRIFISHSSQDSAAAWVIRDWLVRNGWADIFLDEHPVEGVAAGERWQEALRNEAHRCEAVLALISPNWLSSIWCRAEVQTAKLLGKRIFPILLVNISVESLPIELMADHQVIRLATDPLAYERLKEGLRRAGLSPTTFLFEEGRRPFPGLDPLVEDDAGIFFGREAEILQGLDRLRSMRDRGVERVMVVLGASGAGKSSFLRAGLLARLRRDDRNFLALPTIRPENAVISGKFGLIAALEAVLNDAGVSEPLFQTSCPKSRAQIADYLAAEPNGLAELVSELRRVWQPASLGDQPAGPLTVLLSVDQAEEFENREGHEESQRFLKYLSATINVDRRFLVVLASRSDALPLIQSVVLSGILHEIFPLPPMLEGSFRSVIEGPAKVALPSFRIAPALVNALLADAHGQDALPLLAFSLERLYRDHHKEGELTLGHYERMGRVRGALDNAVGQALQRARSCRDLPKSTEALEALLRKAMIPHLCRVNEANEFVRRVARVDDIPVAARPLIKLLVDQHLVVRDRRHDHDGEFAVIEVAHEALLREWPVLNRWLSEEREFLIWLADVERSCRRWTLTRGVQRRSALAAARGLAESPWQYRRRGELKPNLRHFLELTKSTRRMIAAFVLTLAFPFVLSSSDFLLEIPYNLSASTTTHNQFDWFNLRPYNRPIMVPLAYCLALAGYLVVLYVVWIKAVSPIFRPQTRISVTVFVLAATIFAAVAVIFTQYTRLGVLLWP